jgi:hypothetical protein
LEELRAFFQLLVAERQRLATIVSREHRQLLPAEIAQLAELNGALEAMARTIRDLDPPPTSAPVAPPPLPEADFRLMAAKYYDTLVERAKLSGQLMADYGKWLIATIAAAHVGGIYMIATLSGDKLEANKPGIWALVIGLVLILFAGLATWWNWNHNAALGLQWANPRMLIDRNAWPVDNPRLAVWISITYWASLGLGVASAVCIPIAAFLVL